MRTMRRGYRVALIVTLSVLGLLASALLVQRLGSARRSGESVGTAERTIWRLTAQPANRAFSFETTHRYEIDLKAHEYVKVVVDLHGIDAGAVLHAPDGSVLARIEFRQAGPIILDAVTTHAGPHYLDIHSLDASSATGSYTVAIRDKRAAGPADLERVHASSLFAEAEALARNWRVESVPTALDRYRAALTHWKAANDPSGQAAALRKIGETHYALGKPNEALPYLFRARELSRGAADPEDECGASNAIARVYVDIGRMKEAAAMGQQARQRCHAVRDGRGEAEALNVIGDIYMFTGRSRDSVDVYHQALTISSELLDRRGRAQALLNLGYISSDLSRVSDAQQYYEAALALWRAVDDGRGQALTLTGLGHLHVIVGENDRALVLYRQARQILEKIGDRFGLGMALNGIAMVYLRSGDPETAVDYNAAAVDLFRSIEQQNGEASSLMALGTCLLASRRYGEALERYLEALKLFKMIDDQRLEARVLGAIGDVYAELHDVARASSYYEQSRSLARTVADRWQELYALNGIGSLLSRQSKYSEALRYHGQAFRIGKQSKNRFAQSLVLYHLAVAEAGSEHLEQALTHVGQSLDVVESLRSDVGSLDLRASYLASVRDRYELQIDLLMRLHARNPTGNYAALAFDASERARARSLLDGLSQTRANIREGVAPALLERESSTRRSLNAIAQRLMQIQNDASRLKETAALTEELDRQTRAFREVEAQIRAESPRYASLMQPQPLTLSQVQQLALDRQTVLLQYFLGKTQSFVWAVTRDAIVARALPARSEIERHIRSYREALVAPTLPPKQPATNSGSRQRSVGGLLIPKGDDRIGQAAIDLSRILLGPVADLLSVQRVLIVADDGLHSIPFAALTDPHPHGSGTVPVALIAEHEVVNLPSVSTLALIRDAWNQQRRWQKAAIVFADPVYQADDPRLAGSVKRQPAPTRAAGDRSTPSSDDLERVPSDTRGVNALRIGRLTETRREARGIGAVVRQSDIMLDFEATRRAAMSSTIADYRIVHFAAHGVADNDHPELSGIVLSLFDRKGQSQDGFLRLHDIYNLQVPADLVVLSACSTAIGKEVVGEGFIGLVRGFMYAGARRVVASLWEVDDEATSELMTRFYRGMFQRSLTPSAALRAAQLELMTSTKWKAPFYWAGFTLQGDWK